MSKAQEMFESHQQYSKKEILEMIQEKMKEARGEYRLLLDPNVVSAEVRKDLIADGFNVDEYEDNLLPKKLVRVSWAHLVK